MKRFCAAVLCLLLLVGCSAPITPSPSSSAEPDPVLPKNIKLSTLALDMIVDGEDQVITFSVLPEDAFVDSFTWTSSDESVATVSEDGRVHAVGEGKCTLRLTLSNGIYTEATVTVSEVPYFAPAIAFDENDGCTYIDGILIANKTYALPAGYAPGGILPTVMEAWNAMVAAAKKDGISLWIISGYRSYDTQEAIYNRYVNDNGQEEADTYSARPGHSEHQTGLAFDINQISYSFGETAAGKWVAENAARYGFIIRYPESKQHITGYIYEPWHLRYLGTELAMDVYESGLCLEEYLNIDSAYRE
ncbi:MAG: D-alanyl-D-alanine carboxypeptidase family protein [Clostridia bacterium]|nr:D-alanyl-D-alanine carboxypeptidase family protein [Clostridia bacterium]